MTDSPTTAAAEGRPADPAPFPRGYQVLVTIAAAMIVVAGIRAFSASVGPIVLALVIVVVVSPVSRMLRRLGAPGWLAMLGLLAASFGVLVAILASLVWATAELVGLLTSERYANEMGEIQDSVADLLDELGVTGADLESAVGNLDFGAVAGQISSALSSLLGLTSAISLLVITMLFMVLDTARFEGNLDAVTSERPDVARAMRQFASQTRRYFVVSTVFGLVVAAFDVVALMILGVPLALVWGLLSLITNYIPNVGFVIGLVPPALIAYFEGGWRTALWVIGSYAVINFVMQSVIQPKFVGDAVGLSATLTFLSLIFWGWVLGPLGALLAVPMTLLVKALLIDIDPATRWAGPLISLPVTPQNELLVGLVGGDDDGDGDEHDEPEATTAATDPADGGLADRVETRPGETAGAEPSEASTVEATAESDR